MESGGWQRDHSRVHGPDIFIDLSDKLILNILVGKKIVRCYTGLTRIDCLAPGDSPGGYIKICIPVNDAGALPAQFKDNRNQLVSGAVHYKPAQIGASCKEDDIEGLIKESCVYLPASLKDCNKFRRKGFCNHLFHNL